MTNVLEKKHSKINKKVSTIVCNKGGKASTISNTFLRNEHC